MHDQPALRGMQNIGSENPGSRRFCVFPLATWCRQPSWKGFHNSSAIQWFFLDLFLVSNRPETKRLLSPFIVAMTFFTVAFTFRLFCLQQWWQHKCLTVFYSSLGRVTIKRLELPSSTTIKWNLMFKSASNGQGKEKNIERQCETTARCLGSGGGKNVLQRPRLTSGLQSFYVKQHPSEIKLPAHRK